MSSEGSFGEGSKEQLLTPLSLFQLFHHLYAVFQAHGAMI
jgi:hypothetical protein